MWSSKLCDYVSKIPFRVTRQTVNHRQLQANSAWPRKEANGRNRCTAHMRMPNTFAHAARHWLIRASHIIHNSGKFVTARPRLMYLPLPNAIASNADYASIRNSAEIRTPHTQFTLRVPHVESPSHAVCTRQRFGNPSPQEHETAKIAHTLGWSIFYHLMMPNDRISCNNHIRWLRWYQAGEERQTDNWIRFSVQTENRVETVLIRHPI